MGLAIFIACRDRLNWVVMGVASPMGLAILKACRTRLKELVMRSGKSHGICHFIISKRTSPMGLAIFSFNIVKSHGTCHFWILIMANLSFSHSKNGKSIGTGQFWILIMASPIGLDTFSLKKWQVPWQVSSSKLYIGMLGWNWAGMVISGWFEVWTNDKEHLTVPVNMNLYVVLLFHSIHGRFHVFDAEKHPNSRVCLRYWWKKTNNG